MSLLSIQIFIISWSGKHDSAIRIANDLSKVISPKHINIVYSDKNFEFVPNVSCNLIKCSNELFWEDKFKTSLDNCQADNMLVIHADCTCDDWAALATRCQLIMNNKPDVGIWSPLTYGTFLSLPKTKILDFTNTSLSLVAAIDLIVFCISKPVQKRMKKYKYGDDIYGWGIFSAINSYVLANNQFAIVDKSISVHHDDKVQGYSKEKAKKGKISSLSQLSIFELIQYELIMDKLHRIPKS